MLGFGQKNWPGTMVLEGEKPVQVRVRVHQKSLHYRLSISVAGEPILSVPPKGKPEDAHAFLQRHKHWLDVRLQRRAQPVPFVEGATIPLRGQDHVIAGTGKIRGQVTLLPAGEMNQIIVPGGDRHLARRLTDWLKSQALGDLQQRSALHASRLGVQVGKISIRGQSSRWGSCSSAGNLSYNWRLVLAPPFVLDYVAAHEVAHICEMNHSSAFWSKVLQTLPEMDKGRSWLKSHGSTLMGYGVTPAQGPTAKT
ncbi:MAG: M48 family metallopeptidase [Devosiaceae bacterium]|nr:M48 family metallopeptidase [Devosiaceae bacterium]